MEITILEGCRGTGKSTIASLLRQRTPETTLINFTGFHLDGDEGLRKVVNYYNGWIDMLSDLSNHDSDYVFDRFLFSERVYSELYKNYDFRNDYLKFLEKIENLINLGVKINILYLRINDKEKLKTRLNRDKVAFSDVSDNVKESLKQQEKYDSIFGCLKNKGVAELINIHTIDIDNLDVEDTYGKIIEKLKTP